MEVESPLVENGAVDTFIEIISGSWRPEWNKCLAKVILNLNLIFPEINSKNKAGKSTLTTAHALGSVC
jgi:hypothetical protein